MKMRVVVVGGGISGLATAWRVKERFARAGAALDLRVLEAEERIGGKIRSEMSDGFLVEWGPNGFLDSKPDTLRLCRDLGLEGELLPSEDAARKRFIFSEGVLHQVSERPGAFFRSRLLSVRGRLRILREPCAPVTPPGTDTSVAEFACRRLGREAAEKLLDPMVSGIFAGDPALMSLASCFPRILEMEQEHGSLIRAMMRLARKDKKERRREPGAKDKGNGSRAGPAGPGGKLISFRLGMEQLVEALGAALGDSVVAGARVSGISHESGGRDDRGFRILACQQGTNREFPADALVLAVPAYEARGMLESMEPDVGRLLCQIPYSPVIVVGLGFPETEAPGSMDGFGFVVPGREGSPVLGSLWTSSIFKGRVPPGFVLTRNMVGGWRNPTVLDRGDEELQGLVMGLLGEAMGKGGRVCFRKIVRHAKAIPMYLLGHDGRLREIHERLKRFPGLFLTGNAFRGVGLNDCTREAEATASHVADFCLRA